MVTSARVVLSRLLALALASAGCDAVLVVHGRVVSPAGVPVSGARLRSNPYDNRVVQSDRQGCFQLVAVCSPRPGTVPLLVSAAGYRDLEGTVDAPGDRQVKVVIHPDGGAGSGQIIPDSTPDMCAKKPH